MQLHLTQAGAITLRDPLVFTQLEVRVDPQDADQLERALARIGRREGPQHVWLAPAVLRFLSGHAGLSSWESGFAAMLDFARRKGWLSEAGELRAHLNFLPANEVVSVQDFKAAMRALPAGIAAITTGCGESAAGMIVSSLTSISAEPPLVGFFIHQDSSMRASLLESDCFVINVLGQAHGRVMERFLSEPQGAARLKAGRWRSDPDRPPVLQDALASLDCDIVCTQALGTHLLVVGKVRRTACALGEPLVHFNAATHSLAATPEPCA